MGRFDFIEFIPKGGLRDLDKPIPLAPRVPVILNSVL